jgi:hypothetical protein
MAVLYSQNWEAYTVGTALVPNVPDWKTNPSGGGIFTVQNYFSSKALEVIANHGVNASWDWLALSFGYTDFTFRGSHTVGKGFAWGMRVQALTPPFAAQGYWFEFFGASWDVVGIRADGGGDVLASGTIPAYNEADFQFRSIIDSSYQATYYLNGVQIATFDWSTYGGNPPLATGGIGYGAETGATTYVDDILVTDAGGGGGGAALNDTRMRR